MSERPKLKLELTPFDKTLEILGWTIILAIWVLTIINYSNLPVTIPIHYNCIGQADGFGGKGSILTLPLIATILFVGLTILNKFPHFFNYPINITTNIALIQYTSATKLIRYLKFIIVCILNYYFLIKNMIIYFNEFILFDIKLENFTYSKSCS